MLILLRRIPQNTNEQDIIDFLEPALKGGLFKKTGHIESIQILVLKDMQRKTIEFHGLVSIDSEAAANRVIKDLNKTTFKNKPILVREYFHRSWHNDPRINMRQWNEELVDKRKSSRRRPRLEVVTKESLTFSDSEENLRVL